MDNHNKDTKIVINIGWDAVKSSLMKNFSSFAEKGYILSEMNDNRFIFQKSDPRSVDFFLYSEKSDKSGKEYDELIASGWTKLCSYKEYHMMTAPKGTPPPQSKDSLFGIKAAAAVVFAVLLAVSILVIPDTTEVLSVVRIVLTAVCSCGLIFCLTVLIPSKKNKKSNKNGSDK